MQRPHIFCCYLSWQKYTHEAIALPSFTRAPQMIDRRLLSAVHCPGRAGRGFWRRRQVLMTPSNNSCKFIFLVFQCHRVFARKVHFYLSASAAALFPETGGWRRRPRSPASRVTCLSPAAPHSSHREPGRARRRPGPPAHPFIIPATPAAV